MCAGEGRDLLGVLPIHPRRADATALLVELDARNVATARQASAVARLTTVDVARGDAAISDIYAPAIPADVVLACGIFGNVSDGDVENTVRNLSMLCRVGSSVIWTRHRREPDLTPTIRRWFAQAGFDEMSFDALDNETRSGIGTERLSSQPVPFKPGFRFFTFVR
jgi:hypothetical protein